MKEYETIFITQPDLPETGANQINDGISQLVDKHNGHLFFIKNMGRKGLAYPINKFTKGVYYCADYAAEGRSVHEIERMMKYNEDVIRFLTIVKNEIVDVEARKAEITVRGEDVSTESNIANTEAVTKPEVLSNVDTTETDVAASNTESENKTQEDAKPEQDINRATSDPVKSVEDKEEK